MPRARSRNARNYWNLPSCLLNYNILDSEALLICQYVELAGNHRSNQTMSASLEAELYLAPKAFLIKFVVSCKGGLGDRKNPSMCRP